MRVSARCPSCHPAGNRPIHTSAFLTEGTLTRSRGERSGIASCAQRHVERLRRTAAAAPRVDKLTRGTRARSGSHNCSASWLQAREARTERLLSRRPRAARTANSQGGQQDPLSAASNRERARVPVLLSSARLQDGPGTQCVRHKGTSRESTAPSVLLVRSIALTSMSAPFHPGGPPAREPPPKRQRISEHKRKGRERRAENGFAEVYCGRGRQYHDTSFVRERQDRPGDYGGRCTRRHERREDNADPVASAARHSGARVSRSTAIGSMTRTLPHTRVRPCCCCGSHRRFGLSQRDSSAVQRPGRNRPVPGRRQSSRLRPGRPPGVADTIPSPAQRNMLNRSGYRR